MKHLIIMVALVLIATLNIDAQTFNEVKSLNHVDSTQLTVSDTAYTVVVSRTGSYKVERISKSGNTYWMYLGYPTTYKHNDETVFVNKAGDEYCYYTVGKTGYPLKRKLTMN